MVSSGGRCKGADFCRTQRKTDWSGTDDAGCPLFEKSLCRSNNIPLCFATFAVEGECSLLLLVSITEHVVGGGALVFLLLRCLKALDAASVVVHYDTHRIIWSIDAPDAHIRAVVWRQHKRSANSKCRIYGDIWLYLLKTMVAYFSPSMGLITSSQWLVNSPCPQRSHSLIFLRWTHQ